uniref:MATH domain-containing protein n=1 Tax=Trichuris muris TaxID=70415 RepID=A0A5S6QAD3_TRIMR
MVYRADTVATRSDRYLQFTFHHTLSLNKGMVDRDSTMKNPKCLNSELSSSVKELQRSGWPNTLVTSIVRRSFQQSRGDDARRAKFVRKATKVNCQVDVVSLNFRHRGSFFTKMLAVHYYPFTDAGRSSIWSFRVLPNPSRPNVAAIILHYPGAFKGANVCVQEIKNN